MIKKADIILIAAIIVLGLALSIFLSFFSSSGDEVKITVDGKLYGTYSLLQDDIIVIRQDGRVNRILIEGGSVSMSSASCHGQDCVHQHAISLSGETIVCLPNRVLIEITGGEKVYDSVSK